MMGSVFAFLGVTAGAFGAHGLKRYFEAHPDMQAVFKTGVEYQMWHALALLAAAWAAARWPGSWVNASGWCFAAGIVLFSGSLYALSLTRIRIFGAITPVGGLAFLAGWLCLALAAWRNVLPR